MRYVFRGGPVSRARSEARPRAQGYPAPSPPSSSRGRLFHFDAGTAGGIEAQPLASTALRVAQNSVARFRIIEDDLTGANAFSLCMERTL